MDLADLSPYITPNDGFYRIDTAVSIPQTDLDSWRLRVDGLVDRPFELTHAELLAMPSIEQTVTIACVSNPVGGRLVGNAVWQGVALADLLERAGVQPAAEGAEGQVVGRSLDGWTAGFPMDVATDGRVAMVAYAMNGEPLPVDHGFPARLIVAGLYGYVSATKWLSQIEVARWDDFDGYWVPRGWAKEGPVKVMARIDRLAPDEQEVLQRAAVIGSVFWSEVLRAISPDLPDLREVLTALQRAQLISERGRVPDLGIEYVFQSKLIRDAAYESLLSPQRIAYHLRIAEYLERQAQADPSAQHQGLYCGALAYHFQQARRPARELHYTLKNADRAKHMYANTDACQHFTHALQLIDQLSAEASDPVLLHDLKIQRFQVLLGRHQVYFLMAAFEEMRADAGALLSLGRELAIDDPTYLIDALLHQPGVGDYQSRIEIEQGIALAEEALELSQQVGDRRRELESLVAIINQRLALSDPTWQELAEKALESARQARDRYFEARLLVGMGGIYAFGDQPERSMEYLEAAAALAMSEGLEDRVTQMALLNLLGLEYERSGDYYRLLTEYQQERLHASRETGHRPMESQALQAVGRITGIYLGDHAAALNALNECRHILSGTRDEVYPLFHIAQIQIAQADHEGAGQALSEIQTIGEPVQDRAQASLKLVHAALLNAKAARAAARGDSSAVTAALEGSLDLIREIVALAESSPLVSQQYEMAALTTAVVAYLGLAQTDPDAHAQQGYLAQALEAAERAHGIYQRFGFAQIVECVSEEVMFRYSQALAANQQQDLAGRYLRRAYDEMMRKHALIPMDSHFRRTYLEQVPLHREIRAAYATRVGSILTEAPPVWHQAEQAA